MADFSNKAKQGLHNLGFGYGDIDNILSKSPTLVRQLNGHYAKGAELIVDSFGNGFAYSTSRDYGDIHFHRDTNSLDEKFYTLAHELGHTDNLESVRAVDWPAAGQKTMQQYHDLSMKSEGLAEYNKNLI